MTRNRRLSSPRPSSIRGATLGELLLLVIVLGGLLAVLLVPSGGGGEDDQSPPTAAERELRALLRGAERYHAVHRDWPESLFELVDAGLWDPGDGVEICRYRLLAGNRIRAPYMLIHAREVDSRTMVFTAYPTWGGRLYHYRAREANCSRI